MQLRQNSIFSKFDGATIVYTRKSKNKSSINKWKRTLWEEYQQFAIVFSQLVQMSFPDIEELPSEKVEHVTSKFPSVDFFQFLENASNFVLSSDELKHANWWVITHQESLKYFFLFQRFFKFMYVVGLISWEQVQKVQQTNLFLFLNCCKSYSMIHWKFHWSEQSTFCWTAYVSHRFVVSIEAPLLLKLIMSKKILQLRNELRSFKKEHLFLEKFHSVLCVG